MFKHLHTTILIHQFTGNLRKFWWQKSYQERKDICPKTSVISRVVISKNANNLFMTSDPPNIRIPILQIFVFVIEGGQENIFLLVENIFWTNEKMFSCPPSITKTKIWRIGIRIFGGSDVVNKLVVFEPPLMRVSRNMANFWIPTHLPKRDYVTYEWYLNER